MGLTSISAAKWKSGQEYSAVERELSSVARNTTILELITFHTIINFFDIIHPPVFQ